MEPLKIVTFGTTYFFPYLEVFIKQRISIMRTFQQREDFNKEKLFNKEKHFNKEKLFDEKKLSLKISFQ